MAIDGMNHFTVLTKDLDATRNFYCGILGLKEGHRPPLGFPGTWLYAGAQPVLHVRGRPAAAGSPAGVLDHMAFSASDLPSVVAKLKSNGIKSICASSPTRACGSCSASIRAARESNWISLQNEAAPA